MIIDCHNDTAYRMYYENEPLSSNNLHIDLARQKGLDALLFYAVFIDPEKTNGDIDGYFYKIYNNLTEQLYINRESPIWANMNGNKAVITLEGGSFIDTLEKVDVLKELGVKAVTLTWNDSNKIAVSQMSGLSGGVSGFGYQVIDKMLENEIIIDLSHISDEAFYDVLDYVNTPILVSHSNARAICPHPRNITDGMFKRVIKNGGVVGINFCRDFLVSTEKHPVGYKHPGGYKHPVGVETIIKHIKHFLNLGGEDNIAFGSDFDGIPDLPDGISGIETYPLIIDTMLKSGISENIVEKITHKNILRAFPQILE